MNRSDKQFVISIILGVIGILVGYILYKLGPDMDSIRSAIEDAKNSIIKKIEEQKSVRKIETDASIDSRRTPSEKENGIQTVLTCLGDTVGAQRCSILHGCMKGTSLPSTTTPDQVLEILGSILTESACRRDALTEILENGKIMVSGRDAVRLLEVLVQKKGG